MNFFKDSDFRGSELARMVAAEVANAKLLKEGRVVYKDEDAHYWGDNQTIGNTALRALLIAIEPISPCTHPSEKVKQVESEYLRSPGVITMEHGKLADPVYHYIYQCECGAIVIPTQFEEKK